MRAFFRTTGDVIDPGTLEQQGVLYRHLGLDPAAYQPVLDDLSKKRGYITQDEVRLSPDGTEGVATAIEYQGAHVALTARIAGDQEILALIPEAEFFAAPRNPGDTVRLSWDEGRAHRLTT